jgi:isopenicillin N synthase-like dioxygenase
MRLLVCVADERRVSRAAVALGKTLFPLFALALDLSEDFFDDKVRVGRRPHCRIS